MEIKDILALIGGLALFLFGMQVMGDALEKKAGSGLKTMLAKMTGNPFKGFLLGLGVTAVIQSSSATTVMVVGFVNSGIMTLQQTLGIIMGANIGTTVTAWILSLTGISGSAWYIQLFKPNTFVPVLAFIGTCFQMFSKSNKKKDTGAILLGFATLMTGMDLMSNSVAGLSNVPEFTNLLTLFTNPVLGLLAGTILTAIIQSSSASVGILQALSATGAVKFGAAVPIVMGQNIGTCVTAMIASLGANKNAKRSALVHLYFNVIGSIVLLVAYVAVKNIMNLDYLDTMGIDQLGIAIIHTSFNILCTVIWIPFTKFLTRLAELTIRDKESEKEKYEILEQRLFQIPSVAVERAKSVTEKMAEISVSAIHNSFKLINNYSENGYNEIKKLEEKVDKYEDRLGSYLVKLSSCELNDEDTMETTKLLHIIGDFERISDHAVNIIESAEEIYSKKMNFSGEAEKELRILVSAVNEIVELAYDAFVNGSLDSAVKVEPLEQVIDELRDFLKKQHITRLQKGECTIELGFVLTDLLTNLERVADHCSNIAGCIIETTHNDMAIHKYLRSVKGGNETVFNNYFKMFSEKYKV